MMPEEIRRRPAAQYLRMSTDRQRYSIEQQAVTISDYAQQAGFEVIATYADAGRSGVTAENRDGLAALLADVIGGRATYSTILVLDVSRWGRYQDPDEAGHYEFLCRAAGVDVLYCAEAFEPGLAGSLYKHIKRVMAGEYSRELSAKVRASKVRNALAGTALGGTARYGFARQIVNSDGSLGKVLERRERKPRPEQTLRFVPEGSEQSAVLRQIFSLFLDEHLTCVQIAHRLNAARKPWIDGALWDRLRVSDLIKCELVTGRQAYGKSTCRLGKILHNPRSTWGSVQVFPPIIPRKTFERAQARLRELDGRRYKTDSEMLDDLREIRARQGRITQELIATTPNASAASTYHLRFGSLAEAYRLIGLPPSARERGRDPDGARLGRTAILEVLRRIYKENGRINTELCHADHALPGIKLLCAEFGTMCLAFRAAGLPYSKTGGDRSRYSNEPAPRRVFPPNPATVIHTGPNGGQYVISATGARRYGERG